MRLTTREKKSILKCLETEGVESVLENPLVLKRYLPTTKTPTQINRIIKYYQEEAKKKHDITNLISEVLQRGDGSPVTSSSVEMWHRVIPNSNMHEAVEGMFVSAVEEVLLKEAEEETNHELRGLYRYLIYVLKGFNPENTDFIELSAHQSVLMRNLISDLESFIGTFKSHPDYNKKVRSRLSESFWKMFRASHCSSGNSADNSLSDSQPTQPSIIRETLQPLNPFDVDSWKMY